MTAPRIGCRVTPASKAFVEKDAGKCTDAVNRGYRRASGDILAYLNCDEQYLPGALAAVREFFEAHPQMWKSRWPGPLSPTAAGTMYAIGIKWFRIRRGSDSGSPS